MFEYFNTAALIVILVIGLPTLLIPKQKEWFLKSLVILCLLLLFIDAYGENRDANESMSDFKNGNTIKCMSGGGAYSSADIYSVSKNEGWRLENKYFIKESLMIKANNCEEL